MGTFIALGRQRLKSLPNKIDTYLSSHWLLGEAQLSR